MNKLIISGCKGRMGRLIAQEADKFGFVVVAGVDPSANQHATFPVYQTFDEIKETADMLVDFSSPMTLPALLSYCKAKTLPCVLGTTGYSDSDLNSIKEAAAFIPVFQSPNMSMGIYVLKQLAAQAAKMLKDFDIEIIEKHHNQKADSPSGTALALLDAVRNEQTLPVYGREGLHTKREAKEIGIHAVRGGTVAGEHEVGFYGSSEVITLSHHAQNRLVFVSGALSAAKWLLGRQPGLYGMQEMLG